jgi:hypothetical protein
MLLASDGLPRCADALSRRPMISETYVDDDWDQDKSTKDLIERVYTHIA